MKNHIFVLLFVSMFLFAACNQAESVEPTATPETPTPEPTPEPEPVLGAGFRYSSYGPWYDPGPAYWASVGQDMSANFTDAVPQAIWIVGTKSGIAGTVLNFPGETEEANIYFTSEDKNEEVLTLFDEMGGQIWLQVEPGDASMEELIRILLDKYGHHPSVIGIGVDVEWLGASGDPTGRPVTDEEAEAWVAAVREYDPSYQVFLKHWLPEYMPPTVRDGLVFVDDSQGLASLDEMVAEFAVWGETFAPAPVGFQYGYDSDKTWWQDLENPPGDIGKALIEAVPNTTGLYWVDFTVLELFPPEDE